MYEFMQWFHMGFAACCEDRVMTEGDLKDWFERSVFNYTPADRMWRQYDYYRGTMAAAYYAEKAARGDLR